MMRNMCFRIDSIGAECFCPFRAKVARHYRYPGRYPGLTAHWPFRPLADSFRPWADSSAVGRFSWPKADPFRPLADSLLPRLMSGKIKVGDVTL